MSHPLQQILDAIEKNKDQGPKPVPAKKETVLKFLQGVQKFAVGDIVKLREGLRDSRVPDYGDEVIVTQVLDVPVRPDGDEIERSEPLDIVIAFVRECDNDECAEDEHMIEVLKDSRRFEKVGSIYD